MNGGQARNVALIDGLKGAIPEGVDVVVCPPYPYLAQVKALAGELGVGLGAQDLSQHSAGAFTGDVAAPMLRDVGCEWVLVGHSERRTLHSEGNQLITAKIAAALGSGLVPILCVGETLEERDGGRAEEVVSSQLASVVSELGVVVMAGLVVAYEPVWAIGTGMVATPQSAQDAARAIRNDLSDTFGTRVGETVRILYGGSVSSKNAVELINEPDVDGFLIGGSALKVDELTRICKLTLETTA
mgnify:CR=1 FL=1